MIEDRPTRAAPAEGSPELALRLHARGTAPVGVIDVRGPQQRVERARSWVREHGTFVEHLVSRHDAGEVGPATDPLIQRLPARGYLRPGAEAPTAERISLQSLLTSAPSGPPVGALKGGAPPFAISDRPAPESTTGRPATSAQAPPEGGVGGPLAHRGSRGEASAQRFEAPALHAVRAVVGSSAGLPAVATVRGGPLVMRRKAGDAGSTTPTARHRESVDRVSGEPDRVSTTAAAPSAGTGVYLAGNAPTPPLDTSRIRSPEAAPLEGASPAGIVVSPAIVQRSSLGITPGTALPLRSPTEVSASAPQGSPVRPAAPLVAAAATASPQVVRRAVFGTKGGAALPLASRSAAPAVVDAGVPEISPAVVGHSRSALALAPERIPVPGTSREAAPRAGAMGPAPAEIVWRKVAPGMPSSGGLWAPGRGGLPAVGFGSPAPAPAPRAASVIARAPAPGTEVAFPDAPAGAGGAAWPDLAQVAEHVTRTLLRQIAVERERRGGGRWL